MQTTEKPRDTSETLAHAPRTPKSSPEVVTPKPARTQKLPPKTVVVAEDDVDMRILLTLTLRSSGYEVVEASTGAELMALLSETSADGKGLHPDLVVSDIRMPGWSGLDVLEALRDAGSTVPVVLITSFGDVVTHEQARRLNAKIVIDKPFELEELEQVVKAVLRTPKPRHLSQR